MKKALLLYICCLLFLTSFAQQENGMLLSDLQVQIESTDAVNAMYNFKFEEAETYFLDLKARYPEHPMPYFLMALSNWWKMMPYLDNEDYTNAYEGEFLSYLDLSIEKGEALFDENDENLEAAFFLCASHGFKGRYYSDNKSYFKAALEGKSALHFLTYTKGKGDLSPEFLFGESLFNYYAEWIKEEYPLLRPLVAMFPKGNKSKGIMQLKEVANSAFYTRVEGQYYLMRIYNVEEEKPREAFPYAQYLATNYPDNPYFQRVYARLCWELGQQTECERVCYDINYKVNIGMPGYEENTGRYASYFLGRILYRKGDFEKAKFYLLKTSTYADSSNTTKMGYSLTAYYYLGLIEKSTSNFSEAEKYFLKVLHLAEAKNDQSAVYPYCHAAYELADLYEKLKYYPQAEKYYKRTLSRLEKLDEDSYFQERDELTNKSNAGLARLKKLTK